MLIFFSYFIYIKCWKLWTELTKDVQFGLALHRQSAADQYLNEAAKQETEGNEDGADRLLDTALDWAGGSDKHLEEAARIEKE